MNKNKVNQLCIYITLGLLVASAFFIRASNQQRSIFCTIDCMVYYRLSSQLMKYGPSGYSANDLGQALEKKEGKELSSYFFEPLFKHPPLYPLMGTIPILIFDDGVRSAALISSLFGLFFFCC